MYSSSSKAFYRPLRSIVGIIWIINNLRIYSGQKIPKKNKLKKVITFQINLYLKNKLPT